MKIGKYIIDDSWKEYSYAFMKKVIIPSLNWYQDITVYKGNSFKPTAPGDETSCFIATSSNFITNTHINIYGSEFKDMNFNTIAEAKQHVDNFLNRLQRLKAFL
jgi:hypothetical protein